MTVASSDVVAAWQKAEDGAGLSARKQNKLIDVADRLVDEALADPASAADLLAMLDETSDLRLKRWLRGRILPDVDAAYDDPDAFRAHPLIALPAEAMPIRPSLALVEVNGDIADRDLFADAEEPGSFSWLAGQPVGTADTEWPRSVDGLPLAHVAQVDLTDASNQLGNLASILGDLDLPSSGTLQVFHDLETTGWDPTDRSRHGWLVRWIERPTHLLAKPRDLETDAFRPPRLVAPVPAISIPSPESAPIGGDELDRYMKASQHIEDQMRSPVNTLAFVDDDRASAWEDDHRPEAPTSRLGGYGHHPDLEELRELLATVLSSDDGDSRIMLFDIAGVRGLEDWFGDSGHLQVWIRRSDLARGGFDQSWCVLRTG